MSVQLSSVSPGAKLPTKESTLNREKDKSSHQHMGGKDWRLFIYGGFSSCAAELGTFPLDTTKTRLQIQGQKVDSRHSAVRYNGMFHALFRITKEEGFRALYSGIAPAVLRQATYGSLKFGIYYSVKGLLVKHGREESLGMNVVCGVIAGTLASTVANPTDVLKVRMQACSRSMQQKTVTQCFYDIYRREGVAGLWRGVGPTAQRAAVITAVELPIYDMSKRYLIEEGFAGDTAYNHLLSSLISSLGGAVATTPIDVVRVRLMNQRRLKMSADVAPEYGAASLPRVRLYSGTIDCLVQTVRHEGVMALYKGFVPTWLRMGPWNVIFFLSYEQLKKLY